MNSENSKYTVLSVDKALSILDLICDNPGLNAAEIGKACSLGKSTTFRMLTTLENRGYIRKTPSGYRPGLKFMKTENSMFTNDELVDVLHPILQSLCEFVNESCQLSVLYENFEMLILDRVNGNSMISANASIGVTYPLYLAAAGSAYLAYMPDAFVRKYAENTVFKPRTPNGVKSAVELYKKVQLTRENGFAEDNEEIEIGLVCYASPVFNAAGQPVACISISGPSTRMITNRNFYISALKASSEKASGLFKLTENS